MLYKNQERVELTKHPDFQEKKKEIERIGYPVTLRVLPTWITTTYTTNGTPVQNVPAQFINYVATEYSEEEGSIEWRYTPTPPRWRNNELVFPTRGERYFENNRRVVKINKENVDLIYFLLYKSGQRGRIFEVVDEQNEVERSVEQERQQIRLKEVLYGTNSVLSGNSDLLKTIAQSWGVDRIESKTEAMLLKQLEQIVMRNERLKKQGKQIRGIDEFLKDTKLDELTKIRALIQEAVEEKVIGFSSNTNNYGWFFLDSDGNFRQKIIGMAPKSEDMKEHKLAEHLQKHEPALSTIREGCGYEEQDSFDPDKIEEYSRQELIEQGKKIGVPVVGRSKEDYIHDFKKYYGKE